MRVALIVPLSGQGQGAVAAAEPAQRRRSRPRRNPNPEITILVKDDRGTPEGAREAASEAISEGAELIIGPLFAGSVRSAGQVARQAGKPVIAFSTDASVATRGVYLLSFLVQAEVDRIVAYAASQGRRSIAALVPDTTYGSVAEAQFREAAAQQRPARRRHRALSGRASRKPPSQRLRAVIGGAAPQADLLFVPENADGLPAVAQALQTHRVRSAEGEAARHGPVERAARLRRAGACRARGSRRPTTAASTPSRRAIAAASTRDPIRLATLSYDAVTLAAALTRMQGSQRFSDAVLTNPAGFAGADGVFRFKPDGTNERALVGAGNPRGSGRDDQRRAALLERNVKARSAPGQRAAQFRAVVQGLEDDAIALGQLQQLVELLLRRVGVDLEAQADRPEADRRRLVDAERAAEIEIALGLDDAVAQIDLKRRRDRLQRHAGAGDERLEQHVAGAQFRARAAARRMQAGDRERAAGLDLAGDVLVVEGALRPQGDDRRFGLGAVLVLQRRLKARAIRVDSMMLFLDFTTRARPPRGRARVAAMFARC